MNLKTLLRSAVVSVILGAATLSAFAQKETPENPFEVLKPKITLHLQDDLGTNGSAVAWDPSLKRYYTAMAGNEEFALESFKKKGKPALQNKAGVDVRGLWYDTEANELMGNAAGQGGIFAVHIGQTGQIIGKVTTVNPGQTQPDYQSVGVWDEGHSEVLYYSDKFVHRFSLLDKLKLESIELFPTNVSDYNTTSMIYTQTENHGIGLLNVKTHSVDYFNMQGEMTGSSKFPDNVQLHDSFRFSYANGFIWIFDADQRTWTGFRAFH